MSEQSYTHKTLWEIRTIVATRVGLDPEGDSSDMATKLLNECIRAASLEANEEVTWAFSQKTLDVTTGIRSGELVYPSGCGPGSILQVSVWLDDAAREQLSRQTGTLYPNTYTPLTRVLMRSEWDADPILEAGGEGADDVTGVPLYWDVRQSIRIRPYTDAAYRMRILYTETPELRHDYDKTVMDAELIMLLAIARWHEHTQDFENANRNRAMAAKRTRRLRAQQATDHVMQMKRGVNLALSTDQEAALLHGSCDCPTFDFSAKGQRWTGGDYR